MKRLSTVQGHVDASKVAEDNYDRNSMVSASTVISKAIVKGTATARKEN